MNTAFADAILRKKTKQTRRYPRVNMPELSAVLVNFSPILSRFAANIVTSGAKLGFLEIIGSIVEVGRPLLICRYL